MTRLLEAAAAVRARLATDWEWLQAQTLKVDPAHTARLQVLEHRREGMAEQLELVEAAESHPDYAKPFAVLLQLSDLSDVPLPACQHFTQTPHCPGCLLRRLAKWQAHADAVQASRTSTAA